MAPSAWSQTEPGGKGGLGEGEKLRTHGFQTAGSARGQAGACAPGSHSAPPPRRWPLSLCRSCWNLLCTRSTACGFLAEEKRRLTWADQEPAGRGRQGLAASLPRADPSRVLSRTPTSREFIVSASNVSITSLPPPSLALTCQPYIPLALGFIGQ